MDELLSTGWRHLTVERNGADVEVALHRPDARNALSADLMDELTAVARLVRRRADVGVVILKGAQTYFSAGADLGGIKERAAIPSLMQSREAAMKGPDMCEAWEEIEAVTIAAIEGYCIGGACALAVACDFRIMGDGAYMRLPEIPLGINMSWRTLPRLVSLVGPARSKRFVMFGEACDAQTCLDWGMAEVVTPKGEALAAARDWAGRLGKLPPLPVRMTKEAIGAIAAANHHASIYMDRDQYLLTSRTEDSREAIQAFLDKRDPSFNGS